MKRLLTFILLFLSVALSATEPLRIPDDGGVVIPFKAEPHQHATIDVMIVYTQESEDWASTRGGITQRINEGIALANEAANNSQLGITYNLIYAYKTDYVETGNSLTDLRRMTFGYSGVTEWQDTLRYMRDVRQKRDNVGADLVILLVARATSAGLGWQLSQEGGRPDYGYSLVAVHYANQLTLVHEIGHNMGAHHNRYQTSSPGPGLWDFSAGWNWYGSDTKGYVSVMSYPSGYPDGFRGTRVEYFSNPNIFHFGTSTGHYDLGDNARTMRQTKHTIASYRSRPTPTPVDPPTGVPFVQIWPNPSTGFVYVKASGQMYVTAIFLGFGTSQRLHVSASSYTQLTLKPGLWLIDVYLPMYNYRHSTKIVVI
jgi:hypothetical protein